MTSEPTPARPAAELAPLFQELSFAWRNLSAYPPGHPTAVAALERAGAALDVVLAGGPVELVAAREALHSGDRKFTGGAAERLAELLRKRGAAGVRFDPGATRAELRTFLLALLVDRRKAREAGSLAGELVAAGLTRIRVRDLDFSTLGLIEGDEAAPVLPQAGGLWERLAKHLVAGGHLQAERLATWIASGRTSTDLVAALLGRGGAGVAPGEAPWGPGAETALFGAAARELVGDSPLARSPEHAATLWATLGPAQRETLVAALVDGLRGQAAPGPVLDALGRVLPPEAVAGIGEALRDRQAKTEAPADSATAGGSAALDPGAVRRLRDLFSGGDLDLELAAAGTAAARATDAEGLARIEMLEPREGVEVPRAAADAAAEAASDAAIDAALVRALVELAGRSDLPAGTEPGVFERLDAVYRRLLDRASWGLAEAAVEKGTAVALAGGSLADAAATSRGHFADRESMAALAAGLRADLDVTNAGARRVVERLGDAAIANLLDILAHEEDRTIRHRLLELMVTLGPAVVRGATALLADSRWYVVRNMLVLLRRVGDPGSVPAVRRCAEHADLRVRLEAIRNLFAFDDELPRELLRRAIQNPDRRLAEAAIELAASRSIVEAVEPLVELLRRPDPFGSRRAVRLKAIRALAELGDPRGLAGLEPFVARFRILPVAKEEKRALYEVLDRFPEAARRPFVERGLRSRDATIRGAARRIAEKDRAERERAEKEARP